MKYTIVIIFIFIAIIIAIAFNLKKRSLYNQLVEYAASKRFKEFDALIETKMSRFLFNPFSIDYLKLNKEILANDTKAIDKMFTSITGHRLNLKQKQEIYSKGFNDNIGIENYAKAKEFLDLVHTLNNAQMDREMDRIYDIYALKGYKYLDEILEETSEMPDTYKGVNEFLISLMYENKGDKKKAAEYRKLSEKHLALLDNKIAKKMKEDNKKAE